MIANMMQRSSQPPLTAPAYFVPAPTAIGVVVGVGEEEDGEAIIIVDGKKKGCVHTRSWRARAAVAFSAPPETRALLAAMQQ